MNPELLNELKGMSVRQLLAAIAEAKTGGKNIYRTYIPAYTKRETAAQLAWFLEIAEEGMLLRDRRNQTKESCVSSARQRNRG